MTPSMKHPLEPDEYDELLRMVRETAKTGQPWRYNRGIQWFYNEHTLEKYYGRLDPSVFILWAGIPQDEFDAFNDLRFRAFDERIRMQRERQERERLEEIVGDVGREGYETVAELLGVREQAELRPISQADGGAGTPAAQALAALTPAPASQPQPRSAADRWWVAAATVMLVAIIAAAALVWARRRKQSG